MDLISFLFQPLSLRIPLHSNSFPVVDYLVFKRLSANTNSCISGKEKIDEGQLVPRYFNFFETYLSALLKCFLTVIYYSKPIWRPIQVVNCLFRI